jgi:ATP-dependent DNA helicase RecG
MVRQLHGQMRNRAKISEPICGALDIQVLEAGEHRVVAVRVPAANRRQRPVYTRDNPYAGTYVRRDEGDFPATRSEVDRMMREASDVAGDEVILPNYTIFRPSNPVLHTTISMMPDFWEGSGHFVVTTKRDSPG